MIISNTAHFAAATNTTVFLAQRNTGLPLGNINLLVDAAKAEGAVVTQVSDRDFLVNNTAWVNYAGVVRPI